MPHTREESGVPESAARREGRPLNVALTDHGLLRAVLTFALALFGLFLIWRFLAGIATAILVLLVGILLAVTLSGPVEWLHQRQKVSRLVASILTMGTILGLVGWSGYLFLPVLTDQFSQFFSTLPSSFSRLEWLGRAANRAGLPIANIGNGPSLSTLISMAIVGVLSTAALYLIGILGALFLNIFTGLIEFIPYFGPVIAAIPPTLLALAGEPVDARG
jgi:predicted PurR-regulated permease PerM